MMDSRGLRRLTFAPRALALFLVAMPGSVAAQSHHGSALDSLVRQALTGSPRIRALREQVRAARARVAPAGVLPDPIASVGVMNFPISEPGFSDFMTMKTVGIAQTLPFPGKLGLQKRAAALDANATDSRLIAARLALTADVRNAYYEIAYIDHALELAEDNHKLLLALVQVLKSRFAAGLVQESDVLKAQVETAGPAEEAAALSERRRALLARLAELIGHPTEVERANVPEAVLRAAIDTTAPLGIVAPALGARVADSPLIPLTTLQQRAREHSPELAALRSEIAAQSARAELARKASLPDFEVSVQYGQRQNNSDMVTLMVAAPLPLHRNRRQEPEITAARAGLAVLEAEYQSEENRVRAEVAVQVAELERARAQLALLVRLVLPPARAALEASIASFKGGRVDLATVLENALTLFNYQARYNGLISDFARTLVGLERVVNAEVLK